MSPRTPDPRTIDVVLAQVDPTPGQISTNVRQAVEIIEHRPQADLAVFPELSLTGYALDATSTLSLPHDTDLFAPIRAACRRLSTSAIVGFVETPEPKSRRLPYNTMLCIERDGSTAGRYRKTHLFGGERAVFSAGDRLGCFEAAGLRIAPMICFDMEVPEVARSLTRHSPDLMVTIAANMDPYSAEHEVASRARALDNRTPHVYVNRVGYEAGNTFAGGSLVADAAGAATAVLARGPETATRAVRVGESVAEETDSLRHVRPELYV